MKKILIFFILLFLIVFSGCKRDKVGKLDKKIIKIGAPLALTGKAAYYGIQTKNGIELAFEEINKNNNFNFKVIYEDTQGDPKVALNAVNKLIKSDGVNILLGPTRSISIVAVAPVTESKEIILFASVAGSDDITEAGDYVFRNRETGKLHGLKAAEFLISKVGRVAVLAAQVTNSLSYKEAFIPRFEKLGGEVVYSTEYNVETKDFKTMITKSEDSAAQAFYLAATTGEDGAILVKQIKEFGFGGLIIGSVAFDDQAFFDSAGEASEGLIITSPTLNVEDIKIKGYIEKYKLRYGEESSFFATNAYDAVKILALAIEYCSGDRNTDCIRDYLYRLRDYPGVGGLTTFDENGDVIKPIQLKIVRDGKFVKYENSD